VISFEGTARWNSHSILSIAKLVVNAGAEAGNIKIIKVCDEIMYFFEAD